MYGYGFQGQESDDEVKGKGNSVNYKYRMHDPRIGRFFAVDPLTASYPHYTPYSFSGNKVIYAIELEGLEEVVVHKLDKSGKWKTIHKYTDNSLKVNINKYYYTNISGGVVKTVAKTWDGSQRIQVSGKASNSTLNSKLKQSNSSKSSTSKTAGNGVSDALGDIFMGLIDPDPIGLSTYAAGVGSGNEELKNRGSSKLSGFGLALIDPGSNQGAMARAIYNGDSYALGYHSTIGVFEIATSIGGLKVETTSGKSWSFAESVTKSGQLVEYGGKLSPVYRGGSSFKVKPGEFKINGETGMVKTTHGVSLDINPNTVSKFGGAFEIISIPDGLKIKQRGNRLEHFEIVPSAEMSIENFQSLLNQVKVKPQ